jgi:hypothetical protein
MIRETQLRASQLALTLLALGALSAVACGGDDSGPYTVTLDPQNPDVVGNRDIVGTIYLPANFPGGWFRLGLNRSRPLAFAVFDDQAFSDAPAGIDRIPYRVRGVGSGSYSIFAGLDLNKNEKFEDNEPVGYYDGTALAPIRDTATLRLFTVEGSKPNPIDFGIGVAPAGQDNVLP